MANESVGRIALDLELESKDIGNNLDKVAHAIAKGLERDFKKMAGSIFDGLTKGLEQNLGAMDKVIEKTLSTMEKRIQKSTKNIQALLNNLKMKGPVIEPTKTVKTPKIQSVKTKSDQPRAPPTLDLSQLQAEQESIAAMLENTNARIELTKSKLTQLRESYAMAFSTEQKNKINEEILKTEKSMSSLIAKSDKLGFKLSDLDRKLEEGAGGARVQASALENYGQKVSNSSNKTGLFRKMLSKLSGDHSKASKASGYHAMSVKRLVSSFLIFSMIFPMVSKGINSLASSLFASLQTNGQFTNSLSQIKSNLMVAFTPIYNAILPAINALMSALATVTSYISGFISALFGKTYSSSMQATQGLIDAKDAMGAYGDAASDTAKKSQKAQLALMGFDEINKLDDPEENNSGGGSGAPVLTPSDIDTTQMTVLEKLANRVKDVLGKLWQPFKNAWAAEGLSTINEAKTALFSILGLLGNIGSSFLTVWTNGSGEIILTLILKIFQDIFKIIGKIASSLSTAWNKGGIGTSIFQGIALAIINVLTLIHSIGETLSSVWNTIGAPICDAVMAIISTTVGIVDDLTVALLSVWNNGGQHLFEGIIQLGAKFIELAAYIYTNFVGPFVTWFLENVSPAVGFLIDKVADLLDGFTAFIGWLSNDGKPILDLLVIVLGSIAAAIGIVKVAIMAWSVATTAWSAITTAATGIGTAFGAMMTFITSPIGLVTLAIASVIAIGTLLYQNWDTICSKARGLWEGLVNIFTDIKESISEKINGAKDMVYSAIEAIKSFFSFNIQWPHIPMPHFDVKPAGWHIGDLLKGKIPSLGINWYAKGGIIDQPTLAMMGENSKSEAVIPLDRNTGGVTRIAELISARMPENGGGNMAEVVSAIKELIMVVKSLNMFINVDGKILFDVIVSEWNKYAEATGKIPVNL